MQLKRIFSTDSVKGTRNYLNTQKKYEIIRTVLYFAISISLFLAGYFQIGIEKDGGHIDSTASANMQEADSGDADPESADAENAGSEPAEDVANAGDPRRVNLLTIVAVLGCLPASKSAVGAIMFLRFKSCSAQNADAIELHSQGLSCLYDMVFTSYKKNFQVSHLAVSDNTVCGFTEDGGFEENEFYKHINGILKLDGHKGITVKVFASLSKYTDRLEQMKALGSDMAKTEAILATLKSVAL